MSSFEKEGGLVLLCFVLFVVADGIDVGSKTRARHEHNPYSSFGYKQTPHGCFCVHVCVEEGECGRCQSNHVSVCICLCLFV